MFPYVFEEQKMGNVNEMAYFTGKGPTRTPRGK